MTRGRIIVTGASGFLGRHLVPALAEVGCTGVAVARRMFPSLPLGWTWREREAALCAGCGSWEPFDVMLHLEVKQHVELATPQDVRQFHAVNVAGTERWLDWCTLHGVRQFVYFSSVKAVRPETNLPTSEDARGSPLSPYGESKWNAEQLVKRWVTQNPSHCGIILRPAVVYGPGCVGNVAAMVTAITRNRFLLIGPNENVKSMVSVENLKAAVIHLLTRSRSDSCDVFNIVDRESYTVRKLDGMIRSHLGKSGNSATLPVSLARAAAAFGDLIHPATVRMFPINSSKLDALLETSHFSCAKLLRTGFCHPQTTDQGLAEMIASR